jgi:hypothetical protein
MSTSKITVNFVAHRTNKCLQVVQPVDAGTTYRQAAQAALGELKYEIKSIQDGHYQQLSRADWDGRVRLLTHNASSNCPSEPAA